MSKKHFQDTINWYDQNAENYAKTIEDKPQVESIELFLSFLPKQAKILDAGCAAGRDANIFKQKGYEVTGIDISEGLINQAKKHFPNLPFLQADFQNIPFQQNAFDGIWAHASLVHAESIQTTKHALSEFFRVLKMNGILYIFVKAQIGEKKTALVTDNYSDKPRLFHYYTQSELDKLLINAGFTVMKNEKQQDTLRAGIQWIRVIAKKTKS